MLAWGDPVRLLDQLPAGQMEHWVTDAMTEYKCAMLAPPLRDQSLLQRLCVVSDCLVVLVNPQEQVGDDLLDLVQAANRTVGMAVLTE